MCKGTIERWSERVAVHGEERYRRLNRGGGIVVGRVVREGL